MAKKKAEGTKRKQRTGKVLTDYRLIEECKVLAGYGLTTEHLAAYFDINLMTFHRMMERDKKLASAVKNGKATVLAEIAGLLVKKAREGNVSAMIFYLKTQGRFREYEDAAAAAAAHAPPAKISYTISTTDPIEAARIYQEIMTRS